MGSRSVNSSSNKFLSNGLRQPRHRALHGYLHLAMNPRSLPTSPSRSFTHGSNQPIFFHWVFNKFLTDVPIYFGDSSMISLWFFNDFPMKFQWCFNEVSMNFRWFFSDSSMIVRWFFNDWIIMMDDSGGGGNDGGGGAATAAAAKAVAANPQAQDF